MSPDIACIRAAAVLIRAGETVAFPTETVYGLGANGLSGEAVRKIFAAKGRPADNPLILHVAAVEAVEELATRIPDVAKELMRRFWPGPLTLVLPRATVVPPEVSAGLPTVAVRMPAHLVAQLLIAEAGVPVAAPSANLSGRPSPTTAAMVLEDMAGRVAAVIDGGPSGIGVESTVLDVTASIPVLLRPGGVTLEQLHQVLGRVEIDAGVLGPPDGVAPRSPGMKYTHYAPVAPLWLVEGENAISTLKRLVAQAQTRGQRVGVLVTAEGSAEVCGDVVEVSGPRSRPELIAANLYHCLRAFDTAGVDIIFAEGIDTRGLGLAVMNRLRKAAGEKIIYT